MKSKKPPQRQNFPGRTVGVDGLLKIVAKLNDQVEKVGAKPSWRERELAALANPDPFEGLVHSTQLQRDAGVMDADEAVFRIAMNISHIAGKGYRSDAELERILAAWKTARKAHGLMDYEDGPPVKEPDDVENLVAAWNRRADAIMATVFREHGEADMADLLLADRAAFFDRIAPGRDKVLELRANGQDDSLADFIAYWTKSQTIEMITPWAVY